MPDTPIEPPPQDLFKEPAGARPSAAAGVTQPTQEHLNASPGTTAVIANNAGNDFSDPAPPKPLNGSMGRALPSQLLVGRRPAVREQAPKPKEDSAPSASHDTDEPPKPLRKIPTGLQAGKRGAAGAGAPRPSSSLSPPSQPGRGLAPAQSWENRRYSRPDGALSALAPPDAPGKFVAFAPPTLNTSVDVYHNTRHGSMSNLGAHTHPVPQQGKGTRHGSMGGQDKPSPAAAGVFELPGTSVQTPVQPGPVELPARESPAKDDRAKWESSKVNYDELYGNDDDYDY
jgi:hypothetical protein